MTTAEIDRTTAILLRVTDEIAAERGIPAREAWEVAFGEFLTEYPEVATLYGIAIITRKINGVS